MLTVEKSIVINAPVGAIFTYVEDPTKLTEWMTSLTEVRNIKGEGVGQTYDWTYRMMGIPLDGTTTVTEKVPNERTTTETVGGVKSTWVFTFASDGEATTMTLKIDYTVPVPVLGKLAEKLVANRNEREMETNLANIKDCVEAG